MLTREENDLLTQTDRGTPGGEFFRRYWQPAALSEELKQDAPLPIRLLGEDLVLYRDEQGRPGLLGLHCAHRGADLSYGRLEDGGLRCIYHGWLYDASGRCLEQPGEPAGSTFHERIRHTAYPCVEKGNIVFAYMGPGQPPVFPAYEFLDVPDEFRDVTKYFQDDNYLQGNEGNYDPQHLSFLHRFFKPGEEDWRQRMHAGDVCPTIDPVVTDFGMHIYAIRKSREKHFVKVRSFVLPSFTAIGSQGEEGYGVNWHVPIDDEHHWRFSIMFRRHGVMDMEARRRARSGSSENYHLTRNKANRYLQDREEMKTETFIGLGRDFVLHDTAVTESQGQIYDRTQEHLGYTDGAIVAIRRQMLKAIQDVQNGDDPPHVIRDAAQNQFPDLMARDDVIPASVPWREHWKSAPEREPAGVAG